MAETSRRLILHGVQLSVRRALLCLLLQWAIQPGMAAAQEPAEEVFDPERMAENLMVPLFQEMALADIQPVILNLAQRSGNDPEFIALLQSIKLEAFGTFSGPYMARAVKQGDARSVQVDLAFIGMTRGFATFIAAKRLLPYSSPHRHVRYMEQWKSDVIGITAISAMTHAGVNTPTFEIWDNYNESQMLEHLLDVYVDEVYQELLTWVILHEVAHHYLGHLQSEPSSDVESRQRESAADLWAFRTMQEMAYRVDAVLDFLALQAEIETAALGEIEESGSHPTWGMRHDLMAAAVVPTGQLPIRMLVAKLESTNIDTGGHYLTTLYLWYPSDPELYGMRLGGIMLDDGYQILSMVDGPNTRTRYFYGRTVQGGSVRITLRRADTDFPELEIQDYAPTESAPYAHGVGFYSSFSKYQAMQVYPGFSVGEALRLNPMDLLMQSLAQVTTSGEVVRAVGDIVRDMNRRNHDVLLRFQQARISEEALKAELLRIGEFHTERIRQVMGSDNFDRWQSALLGQGVTQFAITRALELERDPRTGTIDLFSRLRGHRKDLDVSQPIDEIVIRSTPKNELDSKDIDAFIARYGMFNRKMFNKDPDPGFLNDYALYNVQGTYVIVDYASGLMWQRGGSPYQTLIADARDFIGVINGKQHAGYSDWRLPTVEEVLTLNEPEYYRNQLHIQPLFDDHQTCIWTSDGDGLYYFTLDLPLGLLNRHDANEPCYVRAIRRLES